MKRKVLVICLIFGLLIPGLVWAEETKEVSPAILQLEIRVLETDAERVRQEIRANQLELQNMQLRFSQIQDNIKQLADELTAINAQIKDLQKRLVPPKE